MRDVAAAAGLPADLDLELRLPRNEACWRKARQAAFEICIAQRLDEVAISWRETISVQVRQPKSIG